MIGAIIRMSGAELKSAKPQNDIPLYIAVLVSINLEKANDENIND